MRYPAVIIALIAGLALVAAAPGCSKKAAPTAPPANRAPNAPSNPVPNDGVIVSLTCGCTEYFSWTCTDPDAGDTLRYDLYLGKTNPLAKIDSNLAQTNYLLPALDTNATYSWQVVASDKAGLRTAGPVWLFTTTQ